MKENLLRVENFTIKATRMEINENNLPGKFINHFQGRLNLLNKKDIKVYNLTINGNGRYYFIPGTDFIAMYVLGEFYICPELNTHLGKITEAIA